MRQVAAMVSLVAFMSVPVSEMAQNKDPFVRYRRLGRSLFRDGKQKRRFLGGLNC